MNTRRIVEGVSMKELAIIKDINIGMRDCHKPIIWFTTESLSGSALQVIEDIAGFIRKANCHELSDLNGKPCVVETEGFSCKFVEVYKS